MGNVIMVNSGVTCQEAQRGGQLLTTTVVQSNCFFSHQPFSITSNVSLFVAHTSHFIFI